MRNARILSAVMFLSLGSLVSAQSNLRVGAARLDITPALDPAHPPSGKYAHEKLYVRAIVLDNGSQRAALIAADQANTPEVVWRTASKQIATELNCPVENIVISATHTHSGWGAGGFPGMRALNDPNAPPPPLVGQILNVVRQAKTNLQPARVGFGTGKSYLNVNRDAIDTKTRLWTQAPNLDGPSDKTVAVLEFLAANNQPIAVYIDYAMHPVNGYLSSITSADFAGATSRYVEQAFADKTVALFVQGASGDQNPLYLRAGTNTMASQSGVPITGYVLTREPVEAPLRDKKVNAVPPDPQVVDNLEHVMDSEGVLLGEEAIRVMSNITQLNPDPRITAAQKTVTCPGRKRTDTGREGMAGSYQDGDPVNIRLGVMRIGDIALASVDAEVYSAIATRFKKESPLADTFVVTLANGTANSGYIPNDAAFGAQTFQVLSSRLKPGCAENAIVDGLLDLVSSTAK